MNAPSTDIVDYLQESAQGLDLVEGTDLFAGMQPENKSLIVSVYDSEGQAPIPGIDNYKRPGITILIRGNKQYEYAEAYTLAEDVFTALQEKNNITINGTRYIQIIATSDIFYLGPDDNERPNFSMNFSIHRTS